MIQSSTNSQPARRGDAPLRRVQRLRQREQRFEELLAALEERFAAPADGTNAAEWIERGAAAFDAFQPALHDAHDEHRGALVQIGEEDLGLQPRIDEMQAAEGLLEQKEGELAGQFEALKQRLANGDADTAAWKTELARLAQDGLEWVSGVRAQDLAVRTWLTEALTRDRGVVD